MKSSKMRWLGLIVMAAMLTGAFIPALSQNAEAKSLTPVRYEEVIRSVFYLPSYVALSKGFFKEEGLDVSMKTSWGSDKGTAALLSGNADIVLVGPETAVYIQRGESPEKGRIFCGLTATASEYRTNPGRRVVRPAGAYVFYSRPSAGFVPHRGIHGPRLCPKRQRGVAGRFCFRPRFRHHDRRTRAHCGGP